MNKVNYEQLINNAVKELIKEHLAWSGSDREMPSRDMDNVRGSFIRACREGRYTVDEWSSTSEDERLMKLIILLMTGVRKTQTANAMGSGKSAPFFHMENYVWKIWKSHHIS